MCTSKSTNHREKVVTMFGHRASSRQSRVHPPFTGGRLLITHRATHTGSSRRAGGNSGQPNIQMKLYKLQFLSRPLEAPMLNLYCRNTRSQPDAQTVGLCGSFPPSQHLFIAHLFKLYLDSRLFIRHTHSYTSITCSEM